MITIFVMMAVTTVYLIIFFAVDGYITRKNLKINQREWDEYSKDMTDRQKLDVINDWLICQQIKHKWKYKYIPDIRLKHEPIADDTVRITKEYIDKLDEKTGWFKNKED